MGRHWCSLQRPTEDGNTRLLCIGLLLACWWRAGRRKSAWLLWLLPGLPGPRAEMVVTLTCYMVRSTYRPELPFDLVVGQRA